MVLAGVLPSGAARAQAAGTLVGRVFDADSGNPLQGVTVRASGAAEQTAVTDAEGTFRFGELPAGSYNLRFERAGYRSSTLGDVAVQAGQSTRADFPLPAAGGEGAGEILELEAFVVEASTVDESLGAIELRMESDQLLNIMSAEDLSRFAASDVADALKRVAGVNVVEGQFAIIRGLEDRYNSTTYNGAPIPSPDPDKQSVQLDLFPSDVVSNLVVSKTFAPDLPSNSSGGAIDILTLEYPERFELKISGGTGAESRAWDRFLRFNEGSPVGVEEDGWDVLESEFGGSVGGRYELLDREIRFKGLLNREIDYRTAEGYQEGREPRSCLNRRRQPCGPGDTTGITRSGDLSLGELFLSDGRFDLTQSERTQQDTGYAALGLDLDGEGLHRLDGSYFYTKKEDEVVQLKENGYLPNFDYGSLAERQANGEEILSRDFNDFATFGTWIRRVRGELNDDPSRGPLWFSNFSESRSFDTTRDLKVWQLNGDHRFDQLDWLEGLHLTWAGNHAETTQSEDALGARYFYEPEDTSEIPSSFPVEVDDLGAGAYVANNNIFVSSNRIEESQNFGRLDGEYERDLSEQLTVKLSAGGWYEKADRDVTSNFLEGINVAGSSQFAIAGDTPQQLGERILEEIDGFQREALNSSEREIKALNVSGKATFWQKLDVLGGVRREKIYIESLNEPFTGEDRFGAPATFPEVYLFFDRLDNPARGEVVSAPPPGTVFNDELLGIDVPIDPTTGFVDLLDRSAIESVVNGIIDETKYLPTVGLSYRPIEGLTLRSAWSKTVARPSFREMGFYVSVEPGSDDLIVGNPQLGLSDVESYDLRAEYVWGAFGDLVAVSGFYKRIDDPIESIVVRNPLNFEQSSSALYRTFFNNPNQAKLWGVEVEARKSLDFVGPELLRHVSLGGNFTWINAKVDRTEAELARSLPFFGEAPGDDAQFEDLSDSRRLFNQPKWIANADITFDQPEWGTKVTLSCFAISDLLDAAGSATILPNGQPLGFTLDRYVDWFYQLDLVASQTFEMPRNLGRWTLKFSAKNLTDSKRGILYDPEQTDSDVYERRFQIGRDYSFSISYSFSF